MKDRDILQAGAGFEPRQDLAHGFAGLAGRVGGEQERFGRTLRRLVDSDITSAGAAQRLQQ